jgi:hypothetical protein
MTSPAIGDGYAVRTRGELARLAKIRPGTDQVTIEWARSDNSGRIVATHEGME